MGKKDDLDGAQTLWVLWSLIKWVQDIQINTKKDGYEADNMFQEDIYKTNHDLVISGLGSKILMDEKSKKLNTIISHYESFHSPIIYVQTIPSNGPHLAAVEAERIFKK